MKISIDRNAKQHAKALFARAVARGGGGKLAPAPLVVARRASRRIVFWLLTLSTAAFLAAFGLIALGFTGALDLDRYAPAIEDGLSKNVFQGDMVSLGALRLKREGWAVAVSFADLAVHDANGRLIVSAPRGAVGVSALALLTGSVQLRRVELDGLDLKIVIKHDGGIAVAGVQANEQSAGDLTAQSGLADLQAAFADLRVIAIRDARIAITRESDGATIDFEHVAAGFERRGDDLGVTISAHGPSGPFSLNGLIQGGPHPHFIASAKDIAVNDLLVFSPKDFPFTYDAPLEFQAEGGFGEDGSPKILKASFTLGAGRLAQRPPDTLWIVIDEAGASLAWDSAAGRYVVSEVRVMAGDNHVSLSGLVTPPASADGTWAIALKSDEAVLGPGKPGESPLAVNAKLDAQVTPQIGAVKIGSLTISGPTAESIMSLDSEPDGAGRSLKAQISITKGSAVEVIRLWPRFIVSDVRDWARDNVVSGEFAPSTIVADLDAATIDALVHKRAVAPEHFRGDIHIPTAGLQLFPPGTVGPPLNVVDASVAFTGRDINASAPAGVLEFSPSRKVRAKDLSFVIPDTTPAPRVPAHATVHVSGGADGVAEFTLREPVRSFLGAPLDPASVKGAADATVTVDFPLGQNVQPNEFKVGINGTLTNFGLDQALGAQKFENATLSLQLDPTAFRLSGQGQFLGVPATVDAVKIGKDPGVATIGFTLDNSARKRLGVAPETGIDGPIGVKVKAPWTRTGADVELDLAKASIAPPIFGVIKPAGKPGKGSFSVKPDDSGVSIQNIVVDAGSLSARGSAQIASDGSLQSVKLSPLRIFGSDEMHVDVANDQAVWRVNVKGGQVDARPIIQSFLQRQAAAGNATGADIEFDAQFAGAVGAKNVVLSQVHATASQTAGAVNRLSLQGKLGSSPLTYSRDENGLAHTHVGDMGSLLRFLDIYSRMEGGVLDADLKDAAGVETGQLQLRNFTVRGEPALRQLASASKPANTDAKGQTPFDPDVVTFDKLKAAFTRTNGRIDISDAVVFNPVVGLTTQGAIDFAHNSIDLTGVFIPAYGVNNLVGRIPILGILLSGGSNEGIFAVNYRISGALDKSTLTVDPLSAATPGILRKILGLIDGTVRAPATPADGPSTQ